MARGQTLPSSCAVDRHPPGRDRARSAGIRILFSRVLLEKWEVSPRLAWPGGAKWSSAAQPPYSRKGGRVKAVRSGAGRIEPRATVPPEARDPDDGAGPPSQPRMRLVTRSKS